jgi:hypothetical protein
MLRNRNNFEITKIFPLLGRELFRAPSYIHFYLNIAVMNFDLALFSVKY